MEIQEIRTNEDLVEFLRQTDYFHDAIIRECWLLSSGFVDAEYRMHGDAKPFDARVLLQSQSARLPGVEVEFIRVSRFCVDQIVQLRPGGLVEDAKVCFSFVESRTEEPQVICSAMRYQLLDKGILGSRFFYRIRSAL